MQDTSSSKFNIWIHTVPPLNSNLGYHQEYHQYLLQRMQNKNGSGMILRFECNNCNHIHKTEMLSQRATLFGNKSRDLYETL